MAVVTRRPLWRFCVYLVVVLVTYAWLADALAGCLPEWYLASASSGRDNLFLPTFLPTAMWLLSTTNIQPRFDGVTRPAGAWLCVAYAVPCALFGGYGFAALMALDAIVQIVKVFRDAG